MTGLIEKASSIPDNAVKDFKIVARNINRVFQTKRGGEGKREFTAIENVDRKSVG
nr:hypothetical protein [Treponema endosymbiont of Eucomonympha sp.]